MVLVLLLKNGTQLYEQIRTAELKQGKLVYYRITYYASEVHEVDLKNIEIAYIIAHGKEIKLYLDKM